MKKGVLILIGIFFIFSTLPIDLFAQSGDHTGVSAIILGEPTIVFNLRPRKNLTINMSYDECKTWSVSKPLEPGSSGYADLAIGKDYSIFCLYERDCPIDKDFDTAAMTFARFNLEWLTDGKDKIEMKNPWQIMLGVFLRLCHSEAVSRRI